MVKERKKVWGACSSPNGIISFRRAMRIPIMCLVLELENGKQPPSAGVLRVKTRLWRSFSHPQGVRLLWCRLWGACGAPNGIDSFSRPMRIPIMFLVLELKNGKHPPSASVSRVKTRLWRVFSHPQKEVVISVLS